MPTMEAKVNEADSMPEQHTPARAWPRAGVREIGSYEGWKRAEGARSALAMQDEPVEDERRR